MSDIVEYFIFAKENRRKVFFFVFWGGKGGEVEN